MARRDLTHGQPVLAAAGPASPRPTRAKNSVSLSGGRSPRKACSVKIINRPGGRTSSPEVLHNPLLASLRPVVSQGGLMPLIDCLDMPGRALEVRI